MSSFFSGISNPVLNDMPEFAIRDPAVAYSEGIFYVYYTYVDLRDSRGDEKGALAPGAKSGITAHRPRLSLSTHVRSTADFRTWSKTKEIFGGPMHFSSPGNVFRHPKTGRWGICVQSYPFEAGQSMGDERCRLFIAQSDDLLHWDEPVPLVTEGARVEYNDSPRQIDPFVAIEGGTAYCFYKTVGELGLLASGDGMETWAEALPERPAIGRAHMPTGETVENPFVVRHDGKWWMFLSPCSQPRKIGFTVSESLTNWPPVEYLDFPDLPWAPHGPTAPAVFDVREHDIGKWLMVFHGDTDRITGHEAALGIATSEDLIRWHVP